jgi:hypothetical protein
MSVDFDRRKETGLIRRINGAKRREQKERQKIKDTREEFKELYKGYVGPVSPRTFAFYVGVDDEGVEPYEDLLEVSRENVGKEVLTYCEITTRKPSKKYVRSSLSGDSSTHTEFSVKYGILTNGSQFLIPDKRIVLPTGGRHIHLTSECFFGSRHFFDPEASLLETDIDYVYFQLPVLSKKEDVDLVKISLDKQITGILFGRNVIDYLGNFTYGNEVYDKMKTLLIA